MKNFRTWNFGWFSQNLYFFHANLCRPVYFRENEQVWKILSEHIKLPADKISRMFAVNAKFCKLQFLCTPFDKSRNVMKEINALIFKVLWQILSYGHFLVSIHARWFYLGLRYIAEWSPKILSLLAFSAKFFCIFFMLVRLSQNVLSPQMDTFC